MMLVSAHAFDVGPCGRLMALVTLVDLGSWLPSHLGRNHLKMHHVMTRWTLVTLGAVHGTRGRMPELGDRPLRCRVALGAILAEELDVPILIRVAARTVQDRFLRRDARMAG